MAVDGTNFKALNSKKNNFNEKKLKRHIKHLDTKIDCYFEELEENDELVKESKEGNRF